MWTRKQWGKQKSVIGPYLSRIRYLTKKDIPEELAYKETSTGHNLSHIVDRFMIWLMETESNKSPKCRCIANLYQRRLVNDVPTRDEWLSSIEEDWTVESQISWASHIMGAIVKTKAYRITNNISEADIVKSEIWVRYYQKLLDLLKETQ